MSRFRRLSHTIRYCQYHIVWVPKYRFRILGGAVGEAVGIGAQEICGFTGCEVVELNVQQDHVHLVAMVTSKVSISDLMGRVKGQTAMKVFRQVRQPRALLGQSYLI